MTSTFKRIRIALWVIALLMPFFACWLSAIRADAAEECLRENYAPKCSNDNVWDGYWWQGVWWVPGYIDNHSWYRRMPDWTTGRAVYYARGVMEATAQVRKMSLDGYLDGVALIPCSEIGETVWLRRPGRDWEGPYLVVDCARRGDAWPIMAYRKESVEVGWQTKIRWGGEWPKPDVEVLKYDPVYFDVERETLAGPEWWVERATFENYYKAQPNPIHHARYSQRRWMFGRGAGAVIVDYPEIEIPGWMIAEREKEYQWLEHLPLWY